MRREIAKARKVLMVFTSAAALRPFGVQCPSGVARPVPSVPLPQAASCRTGRRAVLRKQGPADNLPSSPPIAPNRNANSPKSK